MGTFRFGTIQATTTVSITEVSRYRIHGLGVESDVELDGARDRETPIDTWVRGRPDESALANPGDRVIVAEFVAAGRRWWTATEKESGYLLRFHDKCDVEIDSQLTTLVYRPVPSCDPEAVSLLVSGTGLSLLLGLRGSLVLHASGVQIGDCSVAFAGLPGMGKSTLAGLLCSVGGHLISDDALRVDIDPSPRCFRGTNKVRLRRTAASVVDLFPDTAPGISPDDRLTLRPEPSEPECNLSALVIPYPSRHASRFSTERIDSAEAVFRLSPFLRIAKWRRADLVSQHFLQLGDLVQKVPVYGLTVPWNIPFTGKFALALSATVETLCER